MGGGGGGGGGGGTDQAEGRETAAVFAIATLFAGSLRFLGAIGGMRGRTPGGGNRGPKSGAAALSNSGGLGSIRLTAAKQMGSAGRGCGGQLLSGRCE